MDIPLDDLMRFLTPLLPYLLRAGEKAAEEAGRRIAGDAWEGAKSIWGRMVPGLKRRPAAQEALQDALSSPQDEDAQAALRLQLKKLLAEDPALAADLAGLVRARELHIYLHPVPPPAPERPRPIHNLPNPDYLRFVGRERELDWLRQRLHPRDRAWLLFITGIGGVGKSALALRIAHEYRERYGELPPEERFDAIIWASAKEQVLTPAGREAAGPPGLVSRTLADIYQAIAQALDREAITRAAPEGQDREVQKALTAQRTLLILDNLDTMDEAVRAFLRHLPAPTKAIVTSREWLDVADVLRLYGMERGDALALMDVEAEAQGVALSLEEKERLYGRTAGLPLPIRLSLARLGSGETFEQVMRWLGNATGDLPLYCVGGQVELARQRDPNAYRLLLAGSLFDREAGASREVLGEVADLSVADRDDGLTLLWRLNLVNRGADDRFWMLPIVQEYVRERLAEIPDVDQVFRERWARWYEGLLERYPVDPSIYAETANINNVLSWLLAKQRWEELARMDKGIMVLYDTGAFSSVLEIGSSLLDQILIAGSPELLRFPWLLRYADGMSLYGRLEEFRQKWENLKKILEKDGKGETCPELTAIKLGIQARLARWEAWADRQRLAPAIRVVEQAVEEISGLGQPQCEILLITLNSLGLLYLLARDPDRAEQTFLRGVDVLSRCEVRIISPTTWDVILRGNIAIAAARRGEYEKARNGLYEIIPGLREKTDLAEAYMLLAVYEYHLGNLPRAIELGLQADRLFAELGIVKPPWEDFEYQEWLKIRQSISETF